MFDSVQHDDGSFTDIIGSASTAIGAATHTFGGRLTLTNTAGGSVDLGYDSVNEATAQVDFDSSIRGRNKRGYNNDFVRD